MKTNKGWHSRGYLPHFESGETTQIVTFRLADSLPLSVLRTWQIDVNERYSDDENKKREIQRRINRFLDAGCGACELREPAIAEMVEQTLLFFDDERYRLLSWVVMPNHVHALLEVWEGYALGQILHSWKSFSSHEIGKTKRVNSQFWQVDYFDRFIRDEAHWHRAVAYIENNPVKAGLCAAPQDWLYGSARWHSTS